ncbi:MAG: hypothetical protein HY820_23070 [Acidobacteria bacterium]|nr:hypothetical protein [Acidobacteriota bacterium]
MRFTIMALLAAWSIGSASAQPSDNSPDDPPARVARMSYVSGTVSFQPGGVDEWVAAPINRPLTTGDQFWADDQSRAEFHAGTATLRISRLTGFSFLNLSDTTLQARLSQGVLELRVADVEDREIIEVDTPNVSFNVVRPGIYRFEVDPSGQSTMVTVRDGEGDAIAAGQTVPVRTLQRVRVLGIDRPSFDVFPAPAMDEFDFWCAERSRREEQSISARYVSRDMIGYDDLDEHGAWSEIPEYGPVWRPRTVSIDWAPYRYGHWAWIEPWGWTWVDDAPWGFAPFHYGRWVYAGGGWVWVPGPRMRRPAYAPALVGWIGGPRFGVSISIGGGGGVGWFPLGPGEVFVPSYRTSSRYFNHVNVSNTRVTNVHVTNVYNTTVVNNNTTVINNTHYVNRGVPGGVTAVSHETFTRGRSVRQGLVNVNASAVESAQVTRTAAVAPSRQSVLAGAVAARSTPPAAVTERQVVARTPAPAPAVPFNTRRESYQANPGQPLSTDQVRQLQRQQVSSGSRSVVRQQAADAGQTTGQPGDRRMRSVEPANPAQQQTAPTERRRVERNPVQIMNPTERSNPIERQRVEQPRIEQRRVEQPRVEQPRIEQRRVEQPRIEQRRVEQPRVEQPRPRIERTPPPERSTPVERPRVERPQVQSPKEEKPAEQRQERRERPTREKKEN